MPSLTEQLLPHQKRFLAFAEKRLGTRELAQDVLQEAFVRALSHEHTLREDDAVVAWFYRVLRNTIHDERRRRQSRARTQAAAAYELGQPPPEAPRRACACVAQVVETLKPAYADAVRSVDLAGSSVRDYASASGIAPSNAGVRLHRARGALHDALVQRCGACSQDGCRDCTCKHGS